MLATLPAEAPAGRSVRPETGQSTEFRCRMTDETSPNQAADAGRSPRRFGRARTGARRASAFVAGVAATFLAIVLYGVLNPGPPPLTTGDVNQAVASYLAAETPAPPNSELVYAAIQPSIVMIQTDRVASTAPAASAGPAASVSPGPSPAAGLGTGVIVNDAGAILTALHVVADATTITITYPDGTTASASVASRQPESDIAVLQPEKLSPNAAPASGTRSGCTGR